MKIGAFSYRVALGVVLLLSLAGTYPTRSFAQTPVLVRNPSVDCNLSIDGEEVGIIKADQTRKFPMIEGDHLLECSSTDPYYTIDGSEHTNATSSMALNISGPEQRLVTMACVTVPAKYAAERNGAFHPVSIDPGTTVYNPYGDCAVLTESYDDAENMSVKDDGRSTTCGNATVIRVSWEDRDGHFHFGRVPPGNVGYGKERKVRLRP